MQFQFNSDNTIDADQGMAITIESIIKGDLEPFGDRVTRVEVHVSDENSKMKGGGEDKRCQIEVRLAGFDPRSASHNAETLEEAVTGASGKIRRQLKTLVGREKDRRRGR